MSVLFKSTQTFDTRVFVSTFRYHQISPHYLFVSPIWWRWFRDMAKNIMFQTIQKGYFWSVLQHNTLQQFNEIRQIGWFIILLLPYKCLEVIKALQLFCDEKYGESNWISENDTDGNVDILEFEDDPTATNFESSRFYQRYLRVKT